MAKAAENSLKAVSGRERRWWQYKQQRHYMCETSHASADGGDKTKDYVSNRMKIKRVRSSPSCLFTYQAYTMRQIENGKKPVKTIRSKLCIAGMAATCRWVPFSSFSLSFLTETVSVDNKSLPSISRILWATIQLFFRTLAVAESSGYYYYLSYRRHCGP